MGGYARGERGDIEEVDDLGVTFFSRFKGKYDIITGKERKEQM